MNHRERVLAALSHKEPDCLPFDFGSTPTSTITRRAYTSLRHFLGLPQAPLEFFTFAAQSVVPDEEILQHFGVDTRCVRGASVAAVVPQRVGGYEEFSDVWGIRYRKPADSGFYYDLFHHPLQGKDEQQIEAYVFPDPRSVVDAAVLNLQCASVRENGYAVVLGKTYGFGLLHTGAYLLGYEDLLSRMILEPRVVESLLEQILNCKLEFYQHVLQCAGSNIDVVVEADDLGTQRGPIISPELYRAMVKPLQARLFDGIKKAAPHVKILFHSDGAIREFIADLIEIGADAVNPVQFSAHDMEPERLKREYGKDIAFWGGGIDTQNLLPNGDSDTIKRAADKLISVFSRDGGYIFATVHNIQDDVPPENTVALFDQVGKWRRR